ISAGDWVRALGSYGTLFIVGAIACTSWVRKLFAKWKDSPVGSILLVVLFWICVWRLQVEGQNPFMYTNF
ncbi:MAG: hypothetical protein K2G28_08150, partial [Acetatifactor sp.]|nr:hypothetical protein [Acetatifactor sp.]